MNYKFENPSAYPVLTLAYIGDAVFEIYVRSMLISCKNIPVNRLHREATAYVKASAQSGYMEIISERLTDEELAAYKRGRNAHSKTSAKNADILDYRRATGFEALIGYLYVKGEKERLDEIISWIL